MISRIRFVFVFLCIAFGGLSQEHTIRVDRFDLEDGLSHNQVHWVHKDSRGMMWVGTANGINRYDGKSFQLVAAVNFFYTDNRKVVEDQEGDLWLMKKYWNPELFFFNIHTGEVKSVEEKLGSKLSVQEISNFKVIGLSDGSILFRDTKGTLYEYDEKGSFKELAGFENNILELFAVPGTSEFWVEYSEVISSDLKKATTATGLREVCLYRKDKEGEYQKQRSVHIPNDNEIVGVTKGKSLLIFTEGKQLIEIAEDGAKSVQDFSFVPGELKKESEISLVYDEHQDRLLNCVDGVLTVFSRRDTTVLLKTKRYDELKTFRFSSVLVEENIVWLGTTYGLTKVQISSSPFHKIAYKDPDLFGPEEYESCRLIADYIGAEQLNYPSFLTKKQKESIWTQYKGRNGRIWMGGFYGLLYYMEGDSVATKLEYNNSFSKDLKSRVYHFFEDRDQKVWASSANGLYQLDVDKGLVARFATDEPGHFLPANEIRHLHQDAEGVFWIASYDGLIRWEKENNKHQLFTTEDGLSNNHIMAVYEDDFGFLWLSSDNGIMQFEKSTQRVKVYLPEDGITHREFNRAAHYEDAAGNLYFGSLNGITSFHPKDFVDRFYEEPDTPLLLTECKVVSGKTGEAESRLEAFQDNKEIILEPGDRHLQLKFALLDYANNNPNVIQYVYSIDENEERNIGNESGINFDGLAYGNHLLTIKGRTSNGLFSKQTLSIPIVVLKPFYLQSWFLFLSFIAFVILLFLLEKVKTRSLIRRQEELEALVQKRTQTIAAQATELRELDRAKSRFLANISHEFRTPLTLILNTLRSAEVKKLIRSSEQLSFSSTEIDIMGRNAERLEQLINQLLDLSTLESKKMTLTPRPGDFSFYMGQLLESFSLLAKKKEILIDYNNSLTKCRYSFDRDKMDKILYNLLSNAVKFTPKNGKVSVKVENNKNEIVLKIKDSGIGIPEESKALIFDRFYQVNAGETFDYEGTGLGLALVKELVDLHQGQIEVESREGEGTTFTVSLPLEEISSEPMHSIAAGSKVSDASIKTVDLSLAPVKINLVGTKEKPVLLIIEDNEDLLYHHQKSFANSYELILSKDGKEGLEKAFEEIPDLIICDVMLPEKNGFEVCKRLKTDERTNHIPIILLTARAHHEAKLSGLESGADAYLTKPYHQEELALRMNNLLLQKQRLQKQYKSNWKEAAAATAVTTPDQVFLKKCEAILEQELTNRTFGVEEWSAAVGMTRVTLFRKMKSITGQTPSGYIRKYRLEKAKDLLLQSAGNASEVGYMVGFNKPSYFFKCFKDEYEMTVGEFVQTFVTKV